MSRWLSTPVPGSSDPRDEVGGDGLRVGGRGSENVFFRVELDTDLGGGWTGLEPADAAHEPKGVPASTRRLSSLPPVYPFTILWHPVGCDRRMGHDRPKPASSPHWIKRPPDSSTDFSSDTFHEPPVCIPMIGPSVWLTETTRWPATSPIQHPRIFAVELGCPRAPQRIANV